MFRSAAEQKAQGDVGDETPPFEKENEMTTQTKDALSEAKTAASNGVDRATGAARAAAQDAQRRAKETVDTVKDAAAEQAEKGSLLMQDARLEAEILVSRNPLLAVAGAVGVGVLIGMALKSKS